jgi:hypothetical protein
MDVVDVTDVSEVHAAPLFRVELCKVGFCVSTRSYFENLSRGRRVGIDVSSAPIGLLDRENCASIPLRARECTSPPPQIPATHVPEWQVTHPSAHKE